MRIFAVLGETSLIIYPAIDIRDGKCVRLIKGDYNRETIYHHDPVQVALDFVEKGSKVIHVVDLDAAKSGQPENKELIARLVDSVPVPLQLGGGIRDQKIIESYVQIGVKRLVVGTKAAKDPKWFAEMAELFPEKLVAGIDALKDEVATDGWIEKSGIHPVDLAKEFQNLPILGIVYTDISKDGMLQGPNLPAMAKMASSVTCPVIASGGVSEIQDIKDLLETGVSGCIVGRSIYEQTLDLQEALEVSAN